MRKTLGIALLILFAFALGYAPQEFSKRKLAAQLSETELDLRLANLQRQLGLASHEAQRNNFASAAEAARAFFDGCRTLANEGDFEDRPRTKLALTAYASQSDLVLGQLANADPQSRAKLAELYLTMQNVLARRQ